MPRTIRAVFLDAAGTLINVRAPVADTYHEIALAHGGALDRAALHAGFRREFPTMPPMAFPEAIGRERLTAAERDWWRRLVAKVVDGAGTVARFDAFFDALYQHYASGAAWTVYPEVPALLARLRARGLALVVVSNFDTRLHRILAELAITGAVDAIVCSSDAGAAKPDRAIFAAACARVGHGAGECLHVGDSFTADYEGATRAGLAALHLVRGDEEAAGKDRVTTLDDVEVTLT